MSTFFMIMFLVMVVVGIMMGNSAVEGKLVNADAAWEGLGNGVYELHFYRQSGNTHSIYHVRGNRFEIENKIQNTFNKARIYDQYGVRKSANGTIDYFRAFHNHTSRQEGKRVGGCKVTKIG
jgi:hypothetical protein